MAREQSGDLHRIVIPFEVLATLIETPENTDLVEKGGFTIVQRGDEYRVLLT